jgi:hypothetical protein
LIKEKHFKFTATVCSELCQQEVAVVAAIRLSTFQAIERGKKHCHSIQTGAINYNLRMHDTAVFIWCWQLRSKLEQNERFKLKIIRSPKYHCTEPRGILQ